jgi:Arc/MetJ-type ribon-helix-helix transcriptional regulator
VSANADPAPINLAYIALIDTGNNRWRYLAMSRVKVTISIEAKVLIRVDQLVESRVFLNRSQAIQTAIEEKVARLDSNRLALECARLDPAYEQAFADEGLCPGDASCHLY